MIFESLFESAERNELILVDGAMCRFHLRRDGAITIREIIVLKGQRGEGIGRSLVERLMWQTCEIVARCPADLPSNGFWQHLGFELFGVSAPGEGRVINTWRWVRKCA